MSCTQLARWQNGQGKSIDVQSTHLFKFTSVNNYWESSSQRLLSWDWRPASVAQLSQLRCPPAAIAPTRSAKLTWAPQRSYSESEKWAKPLIFLALASVERLPAHTSSRALEVRMRCVPFPHGDKICTGSYRFQNNNSEHLHPQWQQMTILNILCRCELGEHHRRRPKAKCLHLYMFIHLCLPDCPKTLRWRIKNELQKLGSLIIYLIAVFGCSQIEEIRYKFLKPTKNEWNIACQFKVWGRPPLTSVVYLSWICSKLPRFWQLCTLIIVLRQGRPSNFFVYSSE